MRLDNIYDPNCNDRCTFMSIWCYGTFSAYKIAQDGKRKNVLSRVSPCCSFRLAYLTVYPIQPGRNRLLDAL